MKSKEHTNGENSKKANENSIVKSVVFYVISIFLSVIIIMISITIMTTVVLLGYRLNLYYYYLIFIVVSINIGILGVSLRGIIHTYPLFADHNNGKIIMVPSPGPKKIDDNPPGKEILTTEFFSQTELGIIDLLMKHGNVMLQSTIVSSSGISKASASRAITSLENKGVILKQRKGVTNEIILPETYFK
ncbi:MAG: MarR family transcriptional regulator [Ferroplasma sp.]|uniref:helix-turn-helix transcriptional regulator n=1 Tax=Ferroplasma sp. TaxID=2591003 RepID=UPI002814F06F|nr:MarR family transcriptional regulator [Ferroplasma sp.]WMT51961.1 MAG: MarR family transcriptional regulator [Ferroplasma sp.]